MVLRIQKHKENRIFTVYLLAMFALVAVRYLLKVNIPAIVFLAVAMLPIWWGTPSEQLACAMSFVPISIAFQYKYALLILVLAILIKKKGRLKWNGVLSLVIFMMGWELWHALYGKFSYVEYLRGFAEIILLGVVTSIDLYDLDHKLVIRSLTISIVGVCLVMLIMQLQQFNFDFAEVFLRSAQNFRFGQDNMESEQFAINFNSNNLGFICNLSVSGGLLLMVRKEHRWFDVLLVIASAIFAMMTLSRSAIVCLVLLFAGYLFLAGNDIVKKIAAGIGTIAIALLTFFFIQVTIPSVLENITERFQREDVWNGRGGLFSNYIEFLFLSPMNWLFGIGMQQIYEKVVPYVPVASVPHMGLQEVWVAWGLVGLVLFFTVLWRIVTVSKRYAKAKRQLYQFMPLVLTLIYTTSGQLLTSSRALLALTFSYICLCVSKPLADDKKETETYE